MVARSVVSIRVYAICFYLYNWCLFMNNKEEKRIERHNILQDNLTVIHDIRYYDCFRRATSKHESRMRDEVTLQGEYSNAACSSVM